MSLAPTSTRGAATLRRRLRSLLVACAVVLGLILVLTAAVFARLVDRQTAVTDTYFGAITTANDVYLQLVDAETGVRGYALTGDDVTLEPWNRSVASRTSFASVADELAKVSGDASLGQVARAADTAAQRWQDEFARPLIAQVASQGRQSVTTDQVEGGKKLFDDARAAANAYLAQLDDARDAAKSELHLWTRVASAIVAVLVLAALAVGVVLWVALKRWVLEPLDRLALDAQQVADGDLAHPVVPTGPGEIRALGTDVERMRGTLHAQVRLVEASRAEIEAAHDRLADQAEELRRSNRDLEQFAYVASHDLQEPLRKVASFTQLLAKRYGDELDERGQQYVAFAVDGAKRMQRLIQDLLGFSRVGRVGGEVTDVDLEQSLAHALDNLEESITEAGAVVTHDPLPTVRGEAALLDQLFQNLVGNAVKFRDPTRAPRVHLSARRVADSWELECRDNGIGIDPQYAERVFVIFQRLHPKDVYDGTGIGLALCKKIIEFHGGRIWIADDTVEGTSIRWTLPAEDD
ncbi:sensor histidine kinase [Cellulomonas alba]|uniref:histidine kinase n=1 Tax=Cellulomonas alba TaxID=3053467 RepID=A0ABT7SJF8_9CELL|nr:ATP-binding protein [Cellulomonas alba]MDM7856174.1 ATP-binding protein [Cellulomonas alba]